jgi:hypothetical protein
MSFKEERNILHIGSRRRGISCIQGQGGEEYAAYRVKEERNFLHIGSRERGIFCT